ncbi:hypothetical protein COLO4_11376 [Corchorus olitorius]|uniref:Uncharacterized protein n=1 Tax=Corchorus olitorius TaxID=93759 RepID=A0A1R3K4S9_9ROSI|nr:hypothetical protein COLO4_11376 [Corchorus olitorius]
MEAKPNTERRKKTTTNDFTKFRHQITALPKTKLINNRPRITPRGRSLRVRIHWTTPSFAGPTKS